VSAPYLRASSAGARLGLVTTIAAPDDYSCLGLRRAPEGRWWAAVGFHEGSASGPAPITARMRFSSLSARSAGLSHTSVFRCRISNFSIVFVTPARRDDCQSEPQCKASFKIDVVPLTGVVSHYEARAPDLGHYFVGDAANKVFVVKAKWPKPCRAYSGIKAIRPRIVQARIKPHGNETLGRTRFARSKCFSSQNPFHSEGSRYSLPPP
jgi:hypothetical protein